MRDDAMSAVLLREFHRPLELVERDVPELARPDQVRVRIEAAGVCATDLHVIDGRMQRAGVTLPRVLGHENAGWVDAVGELVSTVSVGDPVVLYPAYSCGLCVPCRRGHDMLCERFESIGLSVDGGFAEYVIAAERSLIKLPEGVEPAEAAPHADAGVTAYHAVKRVAHLALPGTTAVVLGAGGVGHVGLQLLHELGSAAVVVVEPNERRRRVAEELGADVVLPADAAVDAVRDLTRGRGAELVLDFVGSDRTHADGMALLARGGTYAIVGYGGTLSIPSAAMVGGEQTVVANLVGGWIDLWEVLQLHSRSRLTIKTETYPLESVNDVLARLRAGEVIGRAVLVPNTTEVKS